MNTKPINPQPSQSKPGGVPRFGRMDLAMDRVESGIARAVNWFWDKQHEQGYWVGELEADSMLEADYIFMHTLLGTGDRGKMERCINQILRHQNEDGGWSLYPGGPSNVNYGVKCYLALKLMGWSADHPVMVKAREGACARRRGALQYFHKDLSVRAGSIRLRCRTRGAAGDRPIS